MASFFNIFLSPQAAMLKQEQERLENEQMKIDEAVSAVEK
jgi:hypothetical protein